MHKYFAYWVPTTETINFHEQKKLLASKPKSLKREIILSDLNERAQRLNA